MWAKFGRKFLVLLSIQLALTCFAFQVRADDDDPPIRVAARIRAGIHFPVTAWLPN